ncbi:MAG: hypothetical protein JSU74_11555 [Candidatus Zixiibacteriota bacterium]|nr:MAG: hypothetical protein JSU74_11555 [candidate division Zixibacteria bacterium]
MNKNSIPILCLVLIILVKVSPSRAQELNENLEFLSPLIGSWEGYFEDRDRQGLLLTMSCEAIVEGNALRMQSVSGGMGRRNLYYWDPEKKQVLYLVLTTNGYVGSGIIFKQGDTIFEVGRQIAPDGTVNETKSAWAMGPEGQVITQAYTMKEGKWHPGHVIVFVKPGQSKK